MHENGSRFTALHVHGPQGHREHMSAARHTQKSAHPALIPTVPHRSEFVARRVLRIMLAESHTPCAALPHLLGVSWPLGLKFIVIFLVCVEPPPLRQRLVVGIRAWAFLNTSEVTINVLVEGVDVPIAH